MNRHVPASIIALECGASRILGIEAFAEISSKPAGGWLVAGEACDTGGCLHAAQVCPSHSGTQWLFSRCDDRKSPFHRDRSPCSGPPQRLAGGFARASLALSPRAVGVSCQPRRHGALLALAPRHVSRVVASDRTDHGAVSRRTDSACRICPPVRAAPAVHAGSAERASSDRGSPLLPDLSRCRRPPDP